MVFENGNFKLKTVFEMRFPMMVIVYLALNYKVDADPKVVFKLKNIVCGGNDKIVENITCSLKAINWNKAVAQMDVDLILPLRNISVHFEIFKKGYSNQYHPFLVNVTFNVCDVLAKRSFLSYSTIILKVMKEFSNVNHTCPLTNHLQARNLYFKEAFWPIFPLGTYMASLTLTENFANGLSQFFGIIKYYFEAMEMVNRNKKPKFNNSSIGLPGI